MKTIYYAPQTCQLHDPNPEHPECPQRLVVIDDIIQQAILPSLVHATSNPANEEDLLLAHSQRHIDHVFENIPTGRSLNFLDRDTVLCSDSKDAALHAVGAVLTAVDTVLKTENNNAFCAVRPPGHHAHRNFTRGFCLFNNVAIGALAALEKHGLQRVAILDFDVHHGDGTQDIVGDNPNIFFASTYEYLNYSSDTMTRYETGINDNVMNVPFMSRTKGHKVVEAWRSKILPKIKTFQPQMIFVSAGFDAHEDDLLGGLEFTSRDYAELMQEIMKLADEICQGRLVVVLEGGYNLEALANSVLACLETMGK